MRFSSSLWRGLGRVRPAGARVRDARWGRGFFQFVLKLLEHIEIDRTNFARVVDIFIIVLFLTLNFRVARQRFPKHIGFRSLLSGPRELPGWTWGTRHAESYLDPEFEGL